MNLFLLLGASTLCLAWLLPGHYFPWMSGQQEFAAAAGALLFGAAAVPVKRVHWPALALISMAAATIPLIQLAVGQIRFVSDGVIPAAYLAGFALCITAGATLARERQIDVIGLAMSAFGVAALICSAMALQQWLDQGTGVFIDAVGPGARVYANFGQPNHLSTALAMGICALLLGHARGKLAAATTTAAVAFLAWGMVMSQSRTGWLFVALLGFGLLALRRRAALAVSPVAVVTGILLFTLAVRAWSPLNEWLLLARQDEAATRLSGGSLRLIHWQVILDAIGQRPWFGYGWNQVTLAQEAAAPSHPATGEMLTSSHNLLLDLMAWSGVPLGLLLGASLAWWMVRQFRACTSAEQAYPLAAIGAVFLHGMLEYPLHYAYFLLPVGLLMGALDARTPASPTWESGRWAYGAPFLAMCALFLLAGSEYFLKIDQATRTLRFVSAGIGIDRVAHAPEPDVVLLDRVRHIHRFILTPARVDPDPAYLPWVRDVAQRHAFPPAMLRHALAAGLNHEPQEAADVLVRLCKMHPVTSCEEGRKSWALLQQRFQELAAIAYPPPELRPAVPSTR